MKYFPLSVLVSKVLVLGAFLIFADAAFAQGRFYPSNNKAEDTLASQIDEYAEAVMSKWQLPGMAMAVSVDNKVILSKGYGVKEQRPADGYGLKGVHFSNRNITSGGVKGVVNEPGIPIDSKTVFQIGSVSKSFTATIMAQLVDEKLVKWNDKVADILSDFQLFNSTDRYVTENLLVMDCFLHNTGLANDCGTYFGNLGYSRDDVYRLLARIEPGFSLRAEYDYNNISFIIAEKIIEKLTGKSWEENIQERIFDRLSMKSTVVNASGFAQSENVATPHDWRYSGKIEVLPLYGEEQALHWLTVIGPAGGVSSNVEDMIRYAQFHCNNGYLVNRSENGEVIDTTFVMPSSAMATLHRGYTITSQDVNRTTLYAPCWFVEQNNRYRLYFHTGTTWGMTALCFFVPEHKLSGVILLNSELNANPRYALMRRVIDLVRIYLGAESEDKTLEDYNTEYYNNYISYRDGVIAEEQNKEKPEFVPENENLSVFVGRYSKDELFGDIYITLQQGKLYLELGKKAGVPGFRNELKHITGTTYEYRCDGYGFKVFFNVEQGVATGFTMEFGSGEERYFGGWERVD